MAFDRARYHPASAHNRPGSARGGPARAPHLVHETRSLITHPPGPALIAILVSISLIGPLAVHLFFSLMPAVKHAFGISDALVGLAFSVSLLVMSVATLVYGSLSDRHGRRPVLLAGLALFCAGTALSALAGSFELLLAGRILQALGAGCGVTLARAIARDAYGTESLVKVVSWLTVAYTLGPMLAPLLGGMIADAFGWRSVFWLCLLAGTAIIVAVWRALPETRPIADLAQQSAQIWRNYASLLALPRFNAYILAAGFCSGTFMCSATASAFLMQDYLGRSATEFGLYFFLFPLGYLFGNLLSSRLARSVSVDAMVLAGVLMQAAVVGAQSAFIVAGHLTPLVLFIPGFLGTFAQGLSMPNAQVGAIRVQPHLAGTAAGMGMFGQLFFGAAFAQWYVLLADGTPMPLVLTATAGAILSLIAGVIPWAMRKRQGAEGQAGG